MKKIIFICLLAIAYATTIFAQDNIPNTEKTRFIVGAYGGFNYNLHSADFKTLYDCVTCNPGFESYISGTGTGFSLGGLFQYPINDKMLIGFRAGLSTLSAELTNDGTIGNTTHIDQNTGLPDNIEDIEVEYSLDSKLTVVGIEPQFTYKPSPQWNLSAGMRFGFFTTNLFSKQEALISHPNLVYNESGNRVRNVEIEQDIPKLNQFQVHFSLGAGYELKIGKKSTLMPEIRFYQGLTNVSDVTWKANNLYAGLAFHSYIMRKEEKIKSIIRKDEFFRDTTVVYIAGLKEIETKQVSSDMKVRYEEDEDNQYEIYEINEKYELRLPKKTEIDIELALEGINPDGTRDSEPKILIEEIESSELFPILPYVFFEEGSADITKSGLSLLTSKEAENFDEELLPWEVMPIYSNVLNIIGYRMTKYPKAKIVVTGTNKNLGNEKDNLKLSEERAQAIRKYLVNIWNIEESRINTVNRNLPQAMANNDNYDGQSENQRAEISSKTYEIMKPLELAYIQKSITPPQIEMIPNVDSETPIKSWNFQIKQDDDEIRNISGKGNVENQIWNIDQKPIPITETSLQVELTAIDEAGTSKTVTKNIEIEQLTIREKRYEMKDDKIIEKFSLILFDYNSADIKPEHSRVLDDIKSRISSNSTIEIAGYADRTGTPAINKELAAKRTSAIKNYLAVPDNRVTVNNVGSDQLLYDNSTPQGRSYCRTVVITIATPVQE
jgi:outer membrane protein OmpA-like peptidoglycan-associated protein